MLEPETNRGRIPRDTEARREDYLAGRSGRPPTDNPYRRESRLALEWLIGLRDGRSRRLTMVSMR